jgi:hypothetical protein
VETRRREPEADGEAGGWQWQGVAVWHGSGEW